MTWEFEGVARSIRDTIACIRVCDAVDCADLNELLDALLPAAMRQLGSSARSIPEELAALMCGATSNDSGDARCQRAPHEAPDRFHAEWRDGRLWAEWSSITPDDDVERLWPDGSVGPRMRKR